MQTQTIGEGKGQHQFSIEVLEQKMFFSRHYQKRSKNYKLTTVAETKRWKNERAMQL